MKEKPTFNDNLMVRLDGNQDGVLTKDEFVDGCIKVIKSFLYGWIKEKNTYIYGLEYSFQDAGIFTSLKNLQFKL